VGGGLFYLHFFDNETGSNKSHGKDKAMKSRAMIHTVLLQVLLLSTLWLTALTASAAPGNAPDVSAYETPTLGLGEVDDLLIPASRIPAWDPGVRGGIPDVPNRVNVLDFGAQGDGTTDDTAALKAAISACPTPGAVYLPTGSYVIKGRINVPSGIVLRGDGPANTHVLATPGVGGKHTFAVVGSKGSSVPLTSPASAGTTQVSLANTSSFVVGQTVELEMDNDDSVVHPRAEHVRGQIIKIIDISGNQLTFDVPLRLDYPLASNPRVYPTTPRQDVGFEDFHVKHVSSDGDESSIFQFWFAVNCWIRNVESEFCARYHVNLGHSRHITVRDSVIHHAYDYGGGGHGYGVAALPHTSDCLITNNTFYMLRHSILPAQGANGNVWSYNFSADDNSQGDQIGLADMNLHGSYSNMSLFEGNVVQWCKVGGTGQSGPYNTFFRNRTMKEGYSKPTNFYRAGIAIDYPTHDQNFIGNTVSGHIKVTDWPSDYGPATRLWIEKNLVFPDGLEFAGDSDISQNTVLENILSDDQAAPWTLPNSFYLSDKPDFWGDLPWPAVGADIDSQRLAAGLPLHKIPAQIRYEQIMGLVPTPTSSSTPANTRLPTSTPTFAPTNTPTLTPTSTPTPTTTNTPPPTYTPTPTSTSLPTNTPTFAPTNTPLPTYTPTPTSTSTPSPTNTPTSLPRNTPALTLTPRPTPEAIATSTSTAQPPMNQFQVFLPFASKSSLSNPDEGDHSHIPPHRP
jgi:hypothetical protein